MIFIDYFEQKATFERTVFQLDLLMRKSIELGNPNALPAKNPVQFLERFQDFLPTVLPDIQFDYTGLEEASLFYLKTMSSELEQRLKFPFSSWDFPRLRYRSIYTLTFCVFISLGLPERMAEVPEEAKRKKNGKKKVARKVTPEVIGFQTYGEIQDAYLEKVLKEGQGEDRIEFDKWMKVNGERSAIRTKRVRVLEMSSESDPDESEDE